MRAQRDKRTFCVSCSMNNSGKGAEVENTTANKKKGVYKYRYYQRQEKRNVEETKDGNNKSQGRAIESLASQQLEQHSDLAIEEDGEVRRPQSRDGKWSLVGKSAVQARADWLRARAASESAVTQQERGKRVSPRWVTLPGQTPQKKKCVSASSIPLPKLHVLCRLIPFFCCCLF